MVPPYTVFEYMVVLMPFMIPCWGGGAELVPRNMAPPLYTCGSRVFYSTTLDRLLVREPGEYL